MLNESDRTPEAPLTKEVLTLIAQMDGSMIALIQAGKSDEWVPQDRRKTRKVFWKEGKLSMIRRVDEVPPFAVTLGDAAAAGTDLMRLAIAAGFNKRRHVHGLGDGAIWIEDQRGDSSHRLR